MNCWIEILIRNWVDKRPRTVAKSWTASIYLTENGNMSMLSIAPSIRGTSDGSTRPYPSWDEVRWVSKHLSMFICFV